MPRRAPAFPSPPCSSGAEADPQDGIYSLLAGGREVAGALVLMVEPAPVAATWRASAWRCTMTGPGGVGTALMQAALDLADNWLGDAGGADGLGRQPGSPGPLSAGGLRGGRSGITACVMGCWWMPSTWPGCADDRLSRAPDAGAAGTGQDRISPSRRWRVAPLSLYHFHRVFTAVVGGPGEMCRRLRMQRAAWRLCYTDASVTAIALGAGLGGSSGFRQGVSPSLWLHPGRFAATGARMDTWIARKDTHGKGHSLMLKATHQQEQHHETPSRWTPAPWPISA